MQRYGVLNGSGSDSGQHLLHWLYMFISWGTIYFPLASIFLFLPHFLSLAKTEENLTLVHFLSPKKVFHTLIRSEKKNTKKQKKPPTLHISSYPYGNDPLAGAELEVRETKTSGSGGALLTWVAWTAINSEPLNCRGISFLLLRPFSTVEQRHITCSLCLLESWVKCCFN